MKKIQLFVATLALAATSFVTTARADKTVSEADAHKFLVWFDGFVDQAVADKASCPKMATDMNASIDSNKALLDKARAAAARGEKLPKDAAEHMQEAGRRMVPAFMACGKDEKVKAAMQRLNFGPHGH